MFWKMICLMHFPCPNEHCHAHYSKIDIP
jgi:hypothetical protein